MKGRKMSAKLALFQWLCLVGNCGVVLGAKNFTCYWNSPYKYNLFGTVTPYDTVRGDLRDQVEDGGCEVLSIWSLHRHGNRNPSADITRYINALQDKIKKMLQDPSCEVLSIWSLHRHGNRNPGADVTRDISALQDKIKKLLQDPSAHWRQNNICAQDMDDLINWHWNSTLENTTSYLTGIGYEEVYALGRRMQIRYEKFLKSVDKVYFRATNEQRTTTSLAALAHGLSEGIAPNFSMFIHPPLERDDLLRPYEYCKRYQDEVIDGQLLTDELAAYDSSPYYLAIRDRVQSKLPVAYELTSTDIFTLYQLCRFDRSWSDKLISPWCSFFSLEDLFKLEYRDDLRHYYRNGYGSEINLKLGALPLKDLYGHFVNVTVGRRKTIVSYFTHDTMLDMVFCALGLYKESESLRGSVWKVRDFEERSWRTSELAAFATNFIAVLSRCDESDGQTYRVRLFINEKTTPLCPEDGCTWKQFVDIFRVFSGADLDFCESGTAAFMTGRTNTTIELATSLFVLIIVLGILQ